MDSDGAMESVDIASYIYRDPLYCWGYESVGADVWHICDNIFYIRDNRRLFGTMGIKYFRAFFDR